MNQIQIRQVLRLTEARTIGVFPADQIPKRWTKPAAVVANTDGHKQPGTHSVAMYVGSNGGVPILTATGYRLLYLNIFFVYGEIVSSTDGIQKYYKVRLRMCVANTVLCFFITCVIIILCVTLLIS
ncbi:uncharacterized protein LOC117177828 [Belonocnema kinseyi]|uniref:uncharacterized protein LOC117177828 n=1 Tax=Belonocnema kinseyi TaxID=2817044 RepID=UPI00143CE8D4|nr:uncharacterized protein LOC117177828 [Belonocnema kinseyi]